MNHFKKVWFSDKSGFWYELKLGDFKICVDERFASLEYKGNTIEVKKIETPKTKNKMSKTTGVEKAVKLLRTGKKVKGVAGIKNFRALIAELRVKGYVIPQAEKGYYKLDLQRTKKSLLK